MPEELDIEMIECFLQEDASDALSSWEAACDTISSQPTEENLNTLFRAAHNLKGCSMMVGFSELGAFVHKIEDLVQLLGKSVAVTPEIVSFLFDCHTFLVSWTEALKSDPKAVPDTSAIEARIPGFLADSSDTPLPEAGESKPEASNKDEGKDIGTILIEQGSATEEQVQQAAKEQDRKIGEILVDQQSVTKEQVDAALKKQQPRTSMQSNETIRISSNKLDDMLRIIGELVIQNEILWHGRESGTLSTKLCDDSLVLVNKGVKELQDAAFTLRMQTLSGLFSRLERTARDIARKQSKKIKIEVFGAEVELDKTVIEKIKDPLVHIIRNAVDHGIESPEKRGENAKPDVATVKLDAINQPNGVLIKIKDDGQGLDPEKLRKKAIEKGILQGDETLTPEETFKLIFHPGFSTKEQITDVSGRGVGMDVVRKAVTDLGGTIDIQSEFGKGTTFEIMLPSSVSIVDALVVQVGKQVYALPINDLDEIVNLGRFDVKKIDGVEKAILLRGQVVPVLRLTQFLPSKGFSRHKQTANAQENESSAKKKDPYVLISSLDGRKLAFQIDSIVGQQSIVIRPLEGSLERCPGISGGTILANGEPGMIVDLPNITGFCMSEFNPRRSQ